MAHRDPLVVLLDVDNTLLDNDAVKADLDRFLVESYGERLRERFWVLYEEVRGELDVVSFPVVFERLHREAPQVHVFSHLTDFLMRYPFKQRLYPRVRAALRYLRHHGVPVILSDGDPWFQAKKITDASLAAAVGGNVLIFTHKEDHLDEVRRWYPAEHYLFFDDKASLVGRVKARMGTDVTGVWVKQGSYARQGADFQPPPDLMLEHIGQARWLTEDQMYGRTGGPVVEPSRRRSAGRLTATA